VLRRDEVDVVTAEALQLQRHRGDLIGPRTRSGGSRFDRLADVEVLAEYAAQVAV
jgi:hypothetical protein